MASPAGYLSVMASTLSLQDAKNRFSEVVAAAEAGTPQHVTKRGKPAVVVLAETEYRRLKEAEEARRGSFLDALKSGPDGDLPLPPRDNVWRDIDFSE